jgi:hypothetical protein
LALLDISTMPETPFFDPRVSGSVFDTIATGRFAPEDRILIEAWIQEAPSTSEADAATRIYVSALIRAGRPLDAVSHLDARIGRRGPLRPSIIVSASEALAAAAQQLDPGELILLEARLSERPWYERLPQDVRTSFASRVAAVRTEFLGPWNRDNTERSMAVAGTAADITGARPNASELVPDKDAKSPRRLAAEAAIVSAAESIARSARLRAEAIEVVPQI